MGGEHQEAVFKKAEAAVAALNKWDDADLVRKDASGRDAKKPRMTILKAEESWNCYSIIHHGTGRKVTPHAGDGRQKASRCYTCWATKECGNGTTDKWRKFKDKLTLKQDKEGMTNVFD